jgi:signal transduction histidine kinase/DNA-binding LacI/PurR family transcriptional regulator
MARSKPVPMIGVYTAELYESYQASVWRGIEVRAGERGVGVITFLGSRVDSPVPSEAACNVAFRIADPAEMDGIIVISAAISTYLAAGATARLFENRPGLCRVSIGIPLAGFSNVSVEVDEVIDHLVRHVVLDHGKTRFGLISGPVGHPETESRRRAFCESLARLDLGLDPNLDECGLFVEANGARAAERMIASGSPIEAVFCMNDRMAIGAMGAFRAAGYRVPEDIAVIGFDDIGETKTTTPPLTTARQPLFELGYRAVDAVIDLMEGGKPIDVALPCTPQIRESCGCPPACTHQIRISELPESISEEERAVVDKLVDDFAAGNHGALTIDLNKALSKTILAGRRVGRWQGFLSYIRSEVERRTGSPIDNEQLELARMLVTTTEIRHEASQRVAIANQLGDLRSVSASLAGAFETNAMLDQLKAALDRLGIPGGYLAVFEPPEYDVSWSRLLMVPKAVERELEVNLPIRFPTRNLLPPQVGDSWRSMHWILEPLVFQEEQLGFMLLPGAIGQPAMYDTLREEVSSALKGALLMEQQRNHEHRLEDEVSRRTSELTRINRELTHEIKRREALEQEVTEISNLTMERIGQDLHDDLCQHLAGIAMHASVARSILKPENDQVASSLDRISGLLSESILRVKQIARGLVPAELEENGMVDAVEALVDAARRTHPARIRLVATPGFSIRNTDKALQVYRILQEALNNALRHSGSDEIAIGLIRENGHLIAEVTDAGTGIPEDVNGNGMGLRIMRYRAEKAGAKISIDRLEPGTRVRCTIEECSS